MQSESQLGYDTLPYDTVEHVLMQQQEGVGWMGHDMEWMLDEICQIWYSLRLTHLKLRSIPELQNDLASVHGTLIDLASDLASDLANDVKTPTRIITKDKDNNFVKLSKITLDEFWLLDPSKQLVFIKVCPNGESCNDSTCVRIHGQWDVKQNEDFVTAATRFGETNKGHMACRDQLLNSVCARKNCGYRHFVKVPSITGLQRVALLHSYWTRPGKVRLTTSK